nr:hypothetical protein [Tanacetum cinerariifolium]
MMLIICYHPPRHTTGGVFGGLDYLHNSNVRHCVGYEPYGFIYNSLWRAERMDDTPITEIDIKRGKFLYPEEDGEPSASISDVFHCVGYEPYGFISNSLWRAERMDGTPITERDIKRGKFLYPEEDGEPSASISDVVFKFRRARWDG